MSLQQILDVMPADGIFKFSTFGLSDMADINYGLYIHNHTDPADEATCARNVRTTSQFTLTGPDVADVLDILIVGRLAGQLNE
jgi:hypothetical protein